MSTVQKSIDRWWELSVIRFLPRWVTPNYFTIMRFILIPVVLYFLAIKNFPWLLFFFVLAALCDSIDGSLARVRNMITPLGKWLDPMADRFLIVLVLIFLILYYPFTGLILTVILMEVLTLIAGGILFFFFSRKKLQMANWWGKLKMFSQALGLIAAILFFIFNWYWLLIVSVVLFLLVIVFNFVGFLIYSVKGIF